MSAVEFLQKLRADGPWVLTAIGPDSRVIVTHTFTTTESSAPVIAEHEGNSNLYYSINPVKRSIGKKAKKADIAAAISSSAISIRARPSRPKMQRCDICCS